MKLSDEEIDLINKSANVVEEVTKQITEEQAKYYDDFVSDKLSAVGFTIDELKKHKCFKIVTGDIYDENHHFLVDGICILIINKKMTFDIDQMNPEVYNSKMELKVIGGIGKNGYIN